MGGGGIWIAGTLVVPARLRGNFPTCKLLKRREAGPCGRGQAGFRQASRQSAPNPVGRAWRNWNAQSV